MPRLYAPRGTHVRRRTITQHARATVASAVVFTLGIFALLAAAESIGTDGGPARGDAATSTKTRLAAAGIPAPPSVLFTENFETAPSATGTRQLGTYIGAGGITYTADPFWLNYSECNGVIASYNTTVWGFDCNNGDSTNARANARRMADVLGQVAAGVVGGTSDAAPVNGSTATTRSNHAVSDWTSTVSGLFTNLRVLDSSDLNLTIPAPRYVSFSLDAAEASCTYQGGVNNSNLNFYTLIAGVETKVNVTPLRPCTDGSASTYTSDFTPEYGNYPPTGWGNGGVSVRAGRYTIDSGTLLTPLQASNLQARIRNVTSSYDGNDFAIDNLRVLDVTPTVDKSFSPALVSTGQTSRLTITVTNTSELGAKANFAFTDNLPAGLRIASAPNATTTCGNGLLTATAGGASVALTGGDLATGQVSCTVTVDVTANAEATYTNSPATNMTLTGLKPGAPGVVQVLNPRITVTKALGSSRVKPTDQFSVALRSGSGAGPIVSSASNATTAGSGSTVSSGTGTTGAFVGNAGTNYYVTESAAASTDLALYDATVTCTDSTGRTPGLPTGAAYTGSNSIVPAAGANISCVITNKGKPPVIKLTKALAGPRLNDTDQFTVAIRDSVAAGPVVNPTTNSTTTGTGATVTAGTGTTGTTAVTGGNTYHLTEAAAGSADLAKYSKTISCVDANNVQAGLPTDAPLNGSWQITPSLGADIACTIINAVARVDVLVEKLGRDSAGSWTPIDGSSWKLHTDASGSPGPVLTSPDVAPVAGSPGEFKIAGLPPGTYWLTEETAPTGHSLLAEGIRFTVAADRTVSIDSGAGNGVVTIGSSSGGDPRITVRDQRALALPNAGGPGRALPLLVGLALLVIAASTSLAAVRRI